MDMQDSVAIRRRTAIALFNEFNQVKNSIYDLQVRLDLSMYQATGVTLRSDLHAWRSDFLENLVLQHSKYRCDTLHQLHLTASLARSADETLSLADHLERASALSYELDGQVAQLQAEWNRYRSMLPPETRPPAATVLRTLDSLTQDFRDRQVVLKNALDDLQRIQQILSMSPDQFDSFIEPLKQPLAAHEELARECLCSDIITLLEERRELTDRTEHVFFGASWIWFCDETIVDEMHGKLAELHNLRVCLSDHFEAQDNVFATLSRFEEDAQGYNQKLRMEEAVVVVADLLQMSSARNEFHVRITRLTEDQLEVQRLVSAIAGHQQQLVSLWNSVQNIHEKCNP
ncbi:hypothetical protein BV20DRAFT_982219 [Pilatotrama ljubarskyi]|nr:hypothetical protein BV20DRAFT_982219 [Pilatotrama ljubarskyi]